jgi:hypothetical protein
MMTTRQLYQAKYEAQLHEWTAKIEELGAHCDKLTAEAKLSAKPHLDTAGGRLEKAKAKLQEITAATDEKWEGVKADADIVWTDIAASFAGAFDALKSKPKN